VLKIINSDENPDYKIPWLLLVLLVPIAGFMIYFMFYDRRLSPKYIKRLTQIRSRQIQTEDAEVIEKLEAEDRQD
jgi:cardiolipin synthase